MRKVTQALVATLGIALLLSTTACSAGDVILVTLEGIVDGSAAVLSTTAAIQNPSADVVLAQQYARDASVAAQKSITEYQSVDSQAVKIAVITGYWSGVAAPAIGQTNSSLLAVGVSQVANLVVNLITHIRSTQPAQPISGVATAHAHVAAVAVSPEHKLNFLQRRALRHDLKRIYDKAERNVQVAEKLIQ